ncbi:MAG: CPBP family intramembrane metalloprotease [Chrysiogenetes bacterium]|nr:CPBP family intramembrane metalloprotease [Chrysiogenetes bacterium]
MSEQDSEQTGPEEAQNPDAEEGAPEQPKPPRRQLLVAEVVLSFGTILALSMVPEFSIGSGSVRLDHPLVLTAALIYLPFVPYAQRRISLSEMGLGSGKFARSVKFAAITGLIIFPLFLLIWYLAGGLALGLPAPRPITSEFPYGAYAWADLVARQFLGAAIPEEWFFRGYLQRRLQQLFPRRFGTGRWSISAAALLTAWLFGLAHAARYGNILRMNVFLPGILFGWARERSDHLAAPILLHAASNLVLMAFVG